jgi:hypothetical protein
MPGCAWVWYVCPARLTSSVRSAALAADRLYWVSAVHWQRRPGSLDVIVAVMYRLR